ncbi:MAG: hypothetical protein EXR27_01545 [Betaproteobacteria bacterium]|nr:hypothetical protein [Betaproteobacteria bacterium]
MPGENSLVLLDLNNPHFLKSLFALEKNDKIQLFKQLEKISKLAWTDVQRDPGLKWEKIHPVPVLLQRHLLDDKQRTLYSIRLTQARRAVVLREGNYMRFLALPKDHDSTYA